MNKQGKLVDEKVIGGIEEVWRDIPKYEDLYQVSSTGNVRSLARRATNGKVLAPQLNNSGYLRVSLSKQSRSKYLYVHHLVATAFWGERPEGMDVNHIDGNKLNNAADNLEYCTRTENMEHARKLGLHDNRGERQWNSKLNETIVRQLRIADSGCGILDEVIAVSGINRRTIMDVIERKTWRHIP